MKYRNLLQHKSTLKNLFFMKLINLSQFYAPENQTFYEDLH